MPKITRIEKQKKSKNRVNVYVDDKFSFGISEALLIDYDIYEGKEIKPNDIEKYKKGDNLSKCLEKGYQLLSYRMRTEKEIREKLLEKFDDMIVEKTIRKLIEYGLINDKEFAKTWIATRQSERSKKALSFELKRKGIPQEIVEESLEAINIDSEFHSALTLIRSRKKYLSLEKNEAYQKVGGFLLRRGYSYNIIKKVIKEIYDNN